MHIVRAFDDHCALLWGLGVEVIVSAAQWSFGAQYREWRALIDDSGVAICLRYADAFV